MAPCLCRRCRDNGRELGGVLFKSITPGHSYIRHIAFDNPSTCRLRRNDITISS